MFLDLVDSNYRNIDLSADLYLSNQGNTSFLTNKQRFQFPVTDAPISDYVDKRTDIDKFRDSDYNVINILS